LKARTVVTKVLLATLPLLVMFGCKHQENSPAAAPQTKGPAAATVATAKAVSAVPKVIASQGGIKISGSQSGSVKVPAKQGGYLVKFRYKGYGLKLEVDSALGPLNLIPGGQVAASDGWIECEDLTSLTGNGEQEYRITATDPFEIEFVHLPLPVSADPLPQSYSGTGLKVVGPISLKAGSTAFKVSCPDLKQAGFIAELYDGRTAQNKGIIALGTGTKVAETKRLQLPAAGDYLVKINANGRSDWTIEVSQ